MSERLLQVPEGDENKSGRLLHVDFWPTCVSADKGFTNMKFDRFDTLLPKVNSWLRAHPKTEVIKCETLDKKISCPEDLTDDRVLFDVPHASNKVWHIKGLRLWYSTNIPAPPSGPPRRHAQQVGYRSLVPAVVDGAGGGGGGQKYPLFEDLSATYSTLNENLIDRPLEGRILSVETVSLRFPRPGWEGPKVEPDQSCWEDTPKYHILYVVRIYYVFECPYYEQVGAADFLPDIVTDSPSTKTTGAPKYAEFGSLMRKINTWLDKVKDIRITNIQTLEAAVPSADKAERANTSLNFLPRVDTLAATVRFLRVTYVRPKYGLPPSGLYAPRSVSYATVVPRKVGDGEEGEEEDGDGDGEYETETQMLSRMKKWLDGVENRLLCVEVLSHPRPLLERKRDCGDTTVMRGAWYFPPTPAPEPSDTMHRLPTATIARLFFDGPLDIEKRSELN